MDEYVTRDGVVDPEVRAHVYSLVSALGGAGADEEGRYILGDDALACLRDIKRWLKLYDEKLNRLDVTRCLAEANLVKGDLLEILSKWPEEELENQWKGKVALGCVELLVPLTWPIEKNEILTTVNQYRHIPYLEVAQVTYKREILEHPSNDVLRKAIRLALPSMAIPGKERTARDEGILKLVLYFVRNVVMISAPANLPVEWNEKEVSRSATVRAYHRQDVLAVLLTMASCVAEDFKNQDVILLEVLFHLLKGVDPARLFMSKTQINEKNTADLGSLMQKEEVLLSGNAKVAPSRHNRFGTMIWVKRDDERVSTVSGQDVLRGGQNALEKMDKSKKWNKPRQRKLEDRTFNKFDLPQSLTEQASVALRSFVEDFLDSGFNPLFSHIRKAIEREAERVLDSHTQQFFYLISWFLRAESARRKGRANEEKATPAPEPTLPENSFSIVASVLNQETFILLNRYMQDRYDLKAWHEVDAGMRCFTQILLTVSEMAESPLEDDQEIADNIQNRIFYEESTHDRVLSIVRGYKDQGFSYLDACTELSHVFLRMLEKYSKENVDLQIRSRKRARVKKQKQAIETGSGINEEDANSNPDEEREEAVIASRERAFDFKRFTAKFVTQASVNTFVKFLNYYKDLSDDQLKRVHRFLYRATFKQEMGVLLFRVDIIGLLNRMIKGPEPLNKANAMFGEWAEFAKQLFRRLVKKIQARPELGVEMLFSKIPATCFYLEYGYEKQIIKAAPRAPAELEVKGAMTHDEQIGVIVAVLVSEEKDDAPTWIVDTMKKAADERKSWEAEKEARAILQPSDTTELVDDATPSEAPIITIKPDNEARRLALFKDAKLRLLLTLSGLVRQGDRDDTNATWIIPSNFSSAEILRVIELLERNMTNPKTTYGDDDNDPITATDMLRRKPTPQEPRPRKNGLFDEDDPLDDLLDDGEEEFLFPAGGPTARKATALEELKKTRRKRQRHNTESEDEELDEETREVMRKARALKELEKRRKIKSEEFVHDSDDDSDAEKDEEFYKMERGRAEKRIKAHEEQVRVERERQMKVAQSGTEGKRKREGEKERDAKRPRSSDDEGEEEVGEQVESDGMNESSDVMFEEDSKATPAKRKPRSTIADLSDLDKDSDMPDDVPGDEGDNEDTPVSSQSEPRENRVALVESDANRVRQPDPLSKYDSAFDGDEDEGDDLPTQQRRRGRVAVLDDSDDE